MLRTGRPLVLSDASEAARFASDPYIVKCRPRSVICVPIQRHDRFNGAIYIKNTLDFVTNGDVRSGVIKVAVFGFIIALMGCYSGLHSRGGAQGVGAATTNAVVTSSILILAANYFLTSILFSR